MKHVKKLFAVLLIALLVLSLSATAFADGETVTITVERDSSYDDTATGDRVYTWYRVFTATYTANASTGGGVSAGVPGDVTGTATAVAYTATSAVAAKLGSWVAAVGTQGEAGYVAAHWEKATGNEWFILTPIAGSTGYSVTWDSTVATTAANVQAAAKWLIDNEVYEASGSMTWDATNEEWTAEVVKGYYLLKGTEGANLVAATTNIDIKEKNSYPTIKKEQKDEDGSDFGDSTVSVAIGDTINYQVTVTIPADANKTITITDAMTAGITLTGVVSVDVGTTGYTSAVSGTTVTLTPGDEVAGGDVVITYTATVGADVLTDATRTNTATLNYNDHYTMSDTVDFTTYFTGIKKIDGDTNAPLAGVKFTLKEAGVEFKVKLVDGVYIPDETGSSEVVTDEQGLIKIRGLDNDKEYTLTETETLPGYNMLDEDVTLALEEDTGTAFSSYSAWDEVENNTGTLLPSTGGIGTTIFYVGGSLMVLAAAILLITKRRMGIED